MTNLDGLKDALRKVAEESHQKKPLSDTNYSNGFDIFVQEQNVVGYNDFIIPHLVQILTSLFESRTQISVLEIGPGPRSILGQLPAGLRRKVRKYTAFEPNKLFATKLEDLSGHEPDGEKSSLPFPNLESPPNIHSLPFNLEINTASKLDIAPLNHDQRFDLVLFCHSMYGMKPKHRYIEQALEMLSEGGLVGVFHRQGNLHIDRLVCHRTASFPGVVRVCDDNQVLDGFASFIAGFELHNVDETIRMDWRKVCRDLACYDDPNYLSFSSPEVMMTFNQHATALPELTAHVPLVNENRVVKNWEAQLHHPSAIVRPTEILHVQLCGRWASKYGFKLTVIGGGHGSQCLQSNVVAVDMGAFDQIHILMPESNKTQEALEEPRSLVVVEAGCKTGDIITTTMAAGLTVPLGSRPSVGAGLWLQGGIGHLTRLHGLACDAIVGAIVVSVDSGEVLCVGQVPSQYQPSNAVRPNNEFEILWAIKGAGPNVGIIVSVTFKSFVAPTYSVRNWVLPVRDEIEGQSVLKSFDTVVARRLPRSSSIDSFLYRDVGQLHIGITLFEVSSPGLSLPVPTIKDVNLDMIKGPYESKTVDGVGLFGTEMYISGMHGGHGGGKTSSFKRCLFLKNIGEANIAARLTAAIKSSPSQSYLHLLHGGGAVRDLAADDTAFGCRDWDFACVITGVWPRNKNGTMSERSAVDWVYSVARDLLPVSTGAYGADLGPDPRDEELAKRAFGSNGPRLASLKHSLDPHNILTFTCPLPKAASKPKLIILVTGLEGVGKDHTAQDWASVFVENNITACVMSISDVTKRQYAAATGADLNLLIKDRVYKEQHRPALSEFFQEQVRNRPRLPEEHFENAVDNAGDSAVLFITGMRDKAPITGFSHLVPGSRVVEVHVQCSEEMRSFRRKTHRGEQDRNNRGGSTMTPLEYQPALFFDNNLNGSEAAKRFATDFLLPFCHEDLHILAGMVPLKLGFPSAGTKFRHVLGIAQQPGGLALCTSLLRSRFVGDWATVGAIVSCEAGGFVFASSLASAINIPLVLVRKSGKLPPPTVSVVRQRSYISSLKPDASPSLHFEMERDGIPVGASVVVVDDVLSTGETLCAVLQLLHEAGVESGQVTVMVVAEFPLHRGRILLQKCGFARVHVQSLLVFGGA
ncbi:hypothetical protein P154DRAFT_602877 [Amniculicola lignicola CBS 123094]|uniref:FAD-binding PCMH-type domain-containing protein n=1 Tax=Amniculicola lignicola CBS 123094 TaxID=1392246 RepID=A0A6A5WEX0_9PLEO|nr:hypothetical protein P154DRAFT_602877 [Amniculicola lignicola CBS 123094]